MKIIAIDGDLPDKFVLSWGACAIQTNSGEIFNSLTRFTCPNWEEVVEDGCVTLIPDLEISPELAQCKVILLVVNNNAPYTNLINPTVPLWKIAGDRSYYVFKSTEAFNKFAASMVDTIRHLLKQGEPDIDMVRLGFLLSPKDAFLIETYRALRNQ